MKKIMFNDRYDLTDAVLNGKKTMTRRIIKDPRCTIEGKEVCGFEIHKTPDGVPYDVWLTGPDEESLCQLLPTYKVGEEVAIAQAYKTLRWPALPGIDWKAITDEVTHSKGWANKMFVKAEYMPRRIRITDIKVERLQDISDEDCMKEGIMMDTTTGWYYVPNLYLHRKKKNTVWPTLFEHPKAAYCTLCKKLGMVLDNSANPWVFAYTFELERRARP